MTYQEQLAKVRATIAQKHTQIGDIMTKAASRGSTVNTDEDAQIKALEDEISKLETSAQRYEHLIKHVATAAQTATQVGGQSPEQAEASAVGDPIPDTPAIIKSQNRRELDKGVGFAMLVRAEAIAAKSHSMDTVKALRSLGAPDNIIQAAAQKAATIGTTADSSFAKPLVEYNNLTGEFIELVRKQTVVDKIAGSMRHVPFGVKMPAQTAAATVGWVGEGEMKPVGNPQFTQISLDHAKIAGIVVLSDELIRFSNPKADVLVRDDLVHAVAQFIDNQFFDPDKDEATESPASVLHGVQAVTATGTEPDKIDADTQTLISQMADAGISLESAVWAMSETRAMQLASLRDPLGRPFFEGMTLTGQRTFKGRPVHTSGNLGDKIVLIVPSEILLADDGAVDFAISNEATINMGTKQSPKLVNLWQNNLTGVRAERFIRWRKRNAKAVGYIKYS